MNSGIKFTQIITGFALLLTGIFFLIITILGTMVPSLIVEKSVVIWILIASFMILFLEGSVYWIKKSIDIDEENMEYKGNAGFLSDLAFIFSLYARYKSLKNSVILILMTFVLIGGMVYYFVPRFTEGIVLSAQFYTLVGIYLLYFVVLRRFVLKMIYRIGKSSREKLPLFLIEKDGITIHLKFAKGKLASIFAAIGFISGIMGVLIPRIAYAMIIIFILSFVLMIVFGRKKIIIYPVKIKFSEIEEIKVLSYVEAESFMRYRVNPDVNLRVQSAIEMANFLKDPTNPEKRPNKYLLIPNASGAKTLLIKGENIFYIIAVGNENAEEMINQIKNKIHKKK